MTDLYNRAYRLQIGTTEIDARTGAGSAGLRIAFTIERDEKRTPNNAEIRVWNLSRTARESLAQSESVSVALEAGYVDDVGVIFQGDLRTARTNREGPDLITTVCGGDGENAIRTARINRTFKAGTPVATVLRELGRALGVGVGNLNAAAAGVSGNLSKARTLSGLCADELEAFCRTQGLRWSVQDSALQVRVEGEPVVPGTGYLLRADSGLIGEPEVAIAKKDKSGKINVGSANKIDLADKAKKGEKVITFVALLRADIIPGVAVRLESEAYTGNLVIVQTTHRGDSHSTDWYVEGVGKPY